MESRMKHPGSAGLTSDQLGDADVAAGELKYGWCEGGTERESNELIRLKVQTRCDLVVGGM